MFLTELWNYDKDDFKEDPRYDPEDDEFSTREKAHTRKTRLTLRQIAKLRAMNDVRKMERLEDLKLVRKQYASLPDEDGPLL